jgi:hypothetical protein
LFALRWQQPNSEVHSGVTGPGQASVERTGDGTLRVTKHLEVSESLTVNRRSTCINWTEVDSPKLS